MSLSLATPSCFTALEELLRSELRNEKEEEREGHELRELKNSYFRSCLPKCVFPYVSQQVFRDVREGGTGTGLMGQRCWQ